MRRSELQHGGARYGRLPTGDYRRWSDREKKALVRYIREQQAAGRLTIIGELARELRVSTSVISGWLRWHGDASGRGMNGTGPNPATAVAVRDPNGGFVEVAVVPSEPVSAACGRPTVVSPSGYRVEGLDLPAIVTILRALS